MATLKDSKCKTASTDRSIHVFIAKVQCCRRVCASQRFFVLGIRARVGFRVEFGLYTNWCEWITSVLLAVYVHCFFLAVSFHAIEGSKENPENYEINEDGSCLQVQQS